ncbi:MAG: hypothetical protein JXR69_09765 [Candidatus Delongbacteria bacterium]|nr:hypothetical protein [Candidatus Delongbacteria bacterium]
MIEKIYQIGKCLSGNQEPIDKYVQKVKIKKNTKIDESFESETKLFIAKVVYNIPELRIEFELQKEYELGDEKRYNFLDTPRARSRKFHLVWLSKDFKNLVKYPFKEIKTQISLERDKIKDFDEKFAYLCKMINMVIESKIDGNKIYTPDNVLESEKFKVYLRKKTGNLSDNIEDQINELHTDLTEEYIKKFLLELKPKQDIAFYIPVIKYLDETETLKEAYITEHREYRNFYLLTKNDTSVTSANIDNSTVTEYCYLCKQKAESVKVPTFERGAITQIFVTTTINSARNISDNKYKENFSICNDCLEAIKVGEKYIREHYRFKFAELNTYLIPYFYDIKDDFDYQLVSNEIKKDTELLFQGAEVKNFINSIKDELDDTSDKFQFWKNNIFSLTFISYQSDGNSFKITNIIEEVSKSRFEIIIKAFAEEFAKLTDYVRKFSIESIYSLIPVKNNSKAKNEAMEFFNALFKLNIIERKNIIKHFCQSMHYLFHLKPDKFYTSSDIYKNLKKGEIFDFTIKDYVFRYLIIINALEKLNILKQEVKSMSEDLLKCEEEAFINTQKLGEQERSLFYLGLILRKIAVKQQSKGHYSAPILQKIQFQGMNSKDIQRLYLDIMEKVKQYEIEKWTNDREELHRYMKGFHNYFDRNLKNWQLSEEENVFYLLSGYAYLVADSTINKDEALENKTNELEGDNKNGN